ncbi:DUF5776 domain-containing protein [Lentilactobacillus diolivorans]|nr:DUF5776 domain-containing protein [Lentilactobacillus diolivorans]GEP24068.1 hypothetical protein LDI01_16610 [Lentilactobacillus diolivorans]
MKAENNRSRQTRPSNFKRGFMYATVALSMLMTGTIAVSPVSAADQQSAQTAASTAANQASQLAVPNLTNEVKATNKFNITKERPLQYTYIHKPFEDLQGAKAWKGAEYAANIPMDAKGLDPTTKKNYIDEWMPDYGTQIFVYLTNYTKDYKDLTTFRDNFTKNDLAKMTTLKSDSDAQLTTVGGKQQATVYYQAMMSMSTLEGLQYATNLQSVYLHPNMTASAITYGEATQNGNLWDISALTKLNKLTDISVNYFSISDVAALANKPDLVKIDLAYNQISDLSPLATNQNPALDLTKGFSNQHILLSPVTFRTGTASYTTPSFIIKNLAANNLPIQVYNANKEDYARLYPSTSDGGNVDSTTITWSNMLPDRPNMYGAFSTLWKDSSSDYNGWIMVPYQIKDGIGNVNVNFQLLRNDKSQLTLAPSSVLSGTVGTSFNIQTDNTTDYQLNRLAGLGYKVYGVFNGTGQVSDFNEKNGRADKVGQTGTISENTQNLTVVFVKQSTIKVDYGSLDENGKFVQFKNGSEPVSDSKQGDFNNPLKVSDTTKNFPNYEFDGLARIVNGKVEKLPANTDTIPFTESDQTIIALYKKQVSTGDGNGGSTPQVTPPSSAGSGTVTEPQKPGQATEPKTDGSTNDPDRKPGSQTNNQDYVAKKNEVIYSIKKIGLYRTENFSKNTRQAWYVKKPRVYRPMFVVTGYTRTADGKLRYRVRDVNHLTKNRHKTGYITASWKYVRPVYYLGKHAAITVINPRGVNGYTKANLTGKIRNYKQGTILKVKGIVRHNLTTRYVLSNGQYVTGNRKLVNMGRHHYPKYVKAKTAVNRYHNVNLTKRNQHYKQNSKKVFKVYNFDYSQANSVTKHGTLRYRIAGGYITGNAKYIQIVR